MGSILVDDENHRQIFYTTVGGDFCDAVVDFNWTGVDGPDYVYDEIFDELWCKTYELFGFNRNDGAFYRFDYRPICDIYRDFVCL